MAKPQKQPKPRNSLRYMEKIDKLTIQRNCTALKLTYDLYDIRDSLGRDLFFVYVSIVKSSFCGRCRALKIKVVDLEKIETFSFKRNVGCTTCLCPCFLQKLMGFAMSDVQIGTINQQWAFGKAAFCIRNDEGDPLYFIRGPWCITKCCKGVNFKIFSNDGKLVGTIIKKWSGRSACYDKLELNFITHITKNNKILLIGAAFLIVRIFITLFVNSCDMHLFIYIGVYVLLIVQ